MTLAENLLLSLSRNPESDDYPGATSQYNLTNALDFVRKTIPNLNELVRNKTVIDFGCGPGWQAVAMRLQCRAQRVFGIDINDTWLSMARSLAEQHKCHDAVSFGHELPNGLDGTVDIALSIGSFEHFDDPGRVLAQMRAAVKPGGLVVITFAEPWYSHNGSHMGFFTRVPWVNILFPETTVLKVRSRFRNDGARRYEEIEGGLNRMTLAKFEQIIKHSGMTTEFLAFYPTKGLPLVNKIPFLRELLVSSVAAILRK